MHRGGAETLRANQLSTCKKKFIWAYEHNAEFEFSASHYGNGLRHLCMAALYCIWSDDCNWTYWDTDLGR